MCIQCARTNFRKVSFARPRTGTSTKSSNLQSANADLVTLHIYSPPLLVMGQYSLIDPTVHEFKDEVYAFTEGAGI